jgi:putative sterol carrier protein
MVDASAKRRHNMALFPSESWWQDYTDRIKASEEVAEAGASWEGDISFVVQAEPDKGLPHDVWSWLDLWHGQCRGSRYGLTPEEGEQAKFIIRGTYSRWKEFVNKEFGPIQGMMTGKLKLKGDIFTVIRHVKAVTVLANIAASVPSEFVDEQA